MCIEHRLFQDAEREITRLFGKPYFNLTAATIRRRPVGHLLKISPQRSTTRVAELLKRRPPLQRLLTDLAPHARRPALDRFLTSRKRRHHAAKDNIGTSTWPAPTGGLASPASACRMGPHRGPQRATSFDGRMPFGPGYCGTTMCARHKASACGRGAVPTGAVCSPRQGRPRVAGNQGDCINGAPAGRSLGHTACRHCAPCETVLARGYLRRGPSRPATFRWRPHRCHPRSTPDQTHLVCWHCARTRLRPQHPGESPRTSSETLACLGFGAGDGHLARLRPPFRAAAWSAGRLHDGYSLGADFPWPLPGLEHA